MGFTVKKKKKKNYSKAFLLKRLDIPFWHNQRTHFLTAVKLQGQISIQTQKDLGI